MRSRSFFPKEIYHIYNRGTEKRNIFTNTNDYWRFLKNLFVCNSMKNVRLDDIVDVFEYDRGEPIVKILAYCLMPNHFHLLIEEIKEGGISKFMQKLQTGYTMYFNKKFERSGVLFQGRFKSRHADSGNYARYLFSYVHLNPINNRNIEKPKALNILNIHTFSSLQDYLGEEREQSKIVDTKRFSDLFQNKEAIINELFDWINLPQGPTLRSQSYEI